MILRRTRTRPSSGLAEPPGAGEPSAVIGVDEAVAGNGTWVAETGGANGKGEPAAATAAVETLESTESADASEPTQADEPGPTPAAPVRVCPHCSSPLAADQEWCIECGTATTHIRTPPDWRIPVAIVGAVIAIAVGGFIVAIGRLSGGSSAPSTSPAPRAATASGLVTISEWPPRVAGWTVVLAHSRSERIAYSKATKLANQGVAAGVLDSSHHPGWARGYWVVFSGRYGTQGEAKAAAVALASKGHHGAHARLVEQPRS
jgi:SPOR domain